MKYIVCWFAIITLLTGCGTTGQWVQSTSTTVDHAMQAWAEFLVQGHATPMQEIHVRNAHNAYIVAEDLMLDALVKKKDNIRDYRQMLLDARANLLTLIDMFSKEGFQP